MERLFSLQGIRGAAVLGVVLFHMAAVELKYSGGDHLLPAMVDFFQLGVDLFFVISGFVMVIVTRGRHQNWVQGLRFAFNRLSRIYPNYWLYFFITLLVYLWQPGMVNSSHGDSNLWMSFALLPSEKVLLVMVAWSLVFELWFYLVFAVFLFLREHWLPLLLAGWAVVLVVFNLVDDWQAYGPALRIMLHPYALEFIAGAAIARFFYSRQSARLPTAAVWAALCLAVFGGFPLIAGFHLFNSEGLVRMLLVALVFGLLVLSLALLERRGLVRVPQFMVAVGDMSYTLYLSHLLVLGVVGRIWGMLGPRPDSLWDNLVFTVLMVAAVLIYGWVAYRCFEKPLLDRATVLCKRMFHTSTSRKRLDTV